MRYKIVTITLTLWLIGILLGSLKSGLLPSWYWYSFLLILPLFVFKKRTQTLWVCTFLIAFGYSRLWRQWYFRSFTEGNQEFTGRVVAPPDIRSTTQYLTTFSDEPIAKNSRGQPERALVLVKADKFLPVEYGDTISVKSKLEKPQVFDSFNYPLFLERDHIFAVAPLAKVKITASDTHFSLIASLARTRGKLEKIINTYIPEPEGSFLAGLLFGSKRAIPSDVTSALQATGTSHMVAISGANITFIVAMALGLFPITNRWGQASVVILVAGGLSLLTGAPASVVRGAVISSTSAVVKATGRRSWPLVTILLAAAIMTVTNPLLIIADPGFQLSFAAYAGLLLFSNFIHTITEKVKIPAAIRGNVTETGAATLGTAPLTIAAGSFALRGMIVNPLVLWLIPPATALGFILLAISFYPPLASLLAIPTWAILHLALSIITTSGKIGNS